MAEQFIFTKAVDMSVLKEGMSIPAVFQPVFYEKLGIWIKKQYDVTTAPCIEMANNSLMGSNAQDFGNLCFITMLGY